MRGFNEIFVEQAEYIETDSFNIWNEEHPNEKEIMKKLSQSGAKLLIGPRGSGKTTIMLKNYGELCMKSKATALPVYVNFKSSLKIEPLYKSDNSAIFWFNQWLLLKVYKGLHQTLKDLELDNACNLKFDYISIDKIINKIEFGKVTEISELNTVTLELIEKEIKQVLYVSNRKHCVLFLDDAAHAFSTEQQRDFFEFFRKVKSRTVSPKAAVYPGVTIYSPSFHVGHDAEELDVWVKPENSEYLHFMLGLLKKRLPREVYQKLTKNQELLEIICYCSFGMPRNLLNMIRHFYKEIEHEKYTDNANEYNVKITRFNADDAISETLTQTLNIFKSLKNQLSTYEKFIEKGTVLYDEIIELLKDYNKGKKPEHQAVNIAIKKPIPNELSKVLGFFQYGGLLMPKGELSKGEKGVFELYTLHYSALVNRNAFIGQKSISTSDLLLSLKYRNAHEYKRVTPIKLLGTDNISEVLPLSLPPCQNCGEARISEHSKFCHNCGAKLKTISVFESLVKNDISVLPLTEKRIKSITDHSNIRTVKDILMDTDNKELRSVPQVGSYWANRIYSYAEEYLV